jgi:hypothetical protein
MGGAALVFFLMLTVIALQSIAAKDPHPLGTRRGGKFDFDKSIYQRHNVPGV